MAVTVESIPIIAALFLLPALLITGESLKWCVADEQAPVDVLQAALNWACGADGGANCSLIQENQTCYLPNTVVAHASYAFNSYYQLLKNKGGCCFFHWAAINTNIDPSHDSCHYEYTP